MTSNFLFNVFFFLCFFLLHLKIDTKCWSFHEEKQTWWKKPAVCACGRASMQPFWSASDLTSPATTGKWLELLQNWWQIPLRGCMAAKLGVNGCLCSIYDEVKLCVRHLLAGAEGLWSGRVDCARLLPQQRKTNCQHVCPLDLTK